MKFKRWIILSIGTLLILAVGGIVLVGINAQNNNTIYGCYKKNNGQLRVVSGSGQCDPSENEISWSSNSNQSTFEDHHQSLVLTAPANQAVTFPIPKNDTPIHFDVSVTGVSALSRSNPENGIIKTPITLLTGNMYHDLPNNDTRILPIKQGNELSSNGGNLPNYFYDVPNGTVYMSYSDVGIQVFFGVREGMVQLRTDVPEESYEIQTPQITYKINMWY